MENTLKREREIIWTNSQVSTDKKYLLLDFRANQVFLSKMFKPWTQLKLIDYLVFSGTREYFHSRMSRLTNLVRFFRYYFRIQLKSNFPKTGMLKIWNFELSVYLDNGQVRTILSNWHTYFTIEHSNNWDIWVIDIEILIFHENNLFFTQGFRIFWKFSILDLTVFWNINLQL